MTTTPSDNIYIDNCVLPHKSLCSLCQNNFQCYGHSQFTQKEIFYNFDQITKIIYPSETPRSADAIYLKNKKIYFVEIKDRKVDGLFQNKDHKKEMAEKILDSIYTIKTHPTYFNSLTISSFIALYSHLKKEGIYNTKIILRNLFTGFGIKINNDIITIPIRSINLYSTHTRLHNREYLTVLNDINLNIKLEFCNKIDERIIE